MKRYLKVLGMVVVFSVFVLSLVSDAVDFKEAIIGKWFEDKGDKQLEFFKEGTVIMDGTPVDYKFIDDNRISLDFVSIRIVYEVSKEGNLILNDGEVNKYLTEKAKEAQIKAEEKRENAELGKRFTVSDLTILDKDTKLMWTRDADIAGKPMTWDNAFKFIKRLNEQKYAGYNDWRLPNGKDLETLSNFGKDQGYKENLAGLFNIIIGFKNVQYSSYWSSTTSDDGRGGTWIVYMDFGSTGIPKKTSHRYVWPVRAGQ